MGFFADRPRPVTVEPVGDVIELVEPATLPRRRVLPGQVSTRVVVFRTADAVLVLDHFEVYRHGVGFRVNLQLREPNDRIDDLLFHESYSWSRSGEPPDGFLRLGVVFCDGSTWSNIDFPPPDEEPPHGPRLEFLDGGGGGDSWSENAWLSPVPPEGPLTFVAAWPAYGIGETEATIDATEFRQAVDKVEDLWPDEHR